MNGNGQCSGKGVAAVRLCCCLLLLAIQGQSWAGAADVHAITSIRLERDCSGCATGAVLLLQRDGAATLSVTGKARLGTQDAVTYGKVRAQDFDALARLALAQGFFGFADVYQDADVMDGAWSTLVITRAGHDKSVFRRDRAGPPALTAIEAAIDAVRAGIQFGPRR